MRLFHALIACSLVAVRGVRTPHASHWASHRHTHDPSMTGMWYRSAHSPQYGQGLRLLIFAPFRLNGLSLDNLDSFLYFGGDALCCDSGLTHATRLFGAA